MKLDKNYKVKYCKGETLEVLNKLTNEEIELVITNLEYDTWLDPNGGHDGNDSGILQVVTLEAIYIDEDDKEIIIEFDEEFVETLSIYLAENYDWYTFLNDLKED